MASTTHHQALRTEGFGRSSPWWVGAESLAHRTTLRGDRRSVADATMTTTGELARLVGMQCDWTGCPWPMLDHDHPADDEIPGQLVFTLVEEHVQTPADTRAVASVLNRWIDSL